LNGLLSGMPPMHDPLELYVRNGSAAHWLS